MKVLVALAVCIAVAQAATLNFYQPVSFQPTGQVVPINPLLPVVDVSPAVPLPQITPQVPEGPVYHEINIPHYEGAPMVIIKVNVQKVAQPEPEPEPETPIYVNLPAFLPDNFFNQAPVFNPADLAKPTPVQVFNPAELSKPEEVFSPADLTKPLLQEEPIVVPEVQAGPLVKIIVNVEN